VSAQERLQATARNGGSVDVAGALIDHLDLWTGAITKKSTSGRGSSGKIELTGIKKLRELILELAVSGRLVSQSPEDTLFKELLLQLRREHAPIKARGRKTVSGDVSGDEQPFDIPRTWTWTRLGEIVEVLDSKRKPITKAARKSGPYPYYGASGVVDYVDGYLFDEPLLLVGEDGAKWDKGEATSFSISGKSWVNNHAHVLRPRREAVTDEYLVYYLTATDLNPYITGMTVPKLNQARLASIPIATPCLEEQHRIVQKVDELMALCDRLEQQTSDQLEAHELLVDTLLGTLTQSENAAELAENWARLAAHFDTLFTTEQSVDKLKQTILQLAVMGRLVEQDAGDEPAIDFLTQIHTRKIELAIQKRIKRPRELARLDVTQHSYPAPSHWAWASFQDIADEISTGPFGSMIHKHDYVEAGVPLINPSHMVGGHIKEDPSVSVPVIKAEELSSYKLATGDIVMARRGEVGRCAVVTDRENGWLSGTGSFVLRFHPAMNRQFILLLFSTDTVRDYLTGNSVGTTMTNLNHGILKKMPVALPPVQEQHRIVQKVDELMALCDQLKERLNRASETRCQLAEAVVEGALN
jgi:type I restriction enzyme S subunit